MFIVWLSESGVHVWNWLSIKRIELNSCIFIALLCCLILSIDNDDCDNSIDDDSMESFAAAARIISFTQFVDGVLSLILSVSLVI